MRLPQEITFFDHLIALQQHVGGTILVEGVPTTKPLRLAQLPQEAPLKALAKAYDFSYQVENETVILVSDFEDPSRVPELTASEMQASLRDLIKVLNALYRPPTETLVTDQVAKLLSQTAPQLREQAYGNQGLHFSLLPPLLRERFTAILFHREYRDWIKQATTLDDTLANLPSAVVNALPDGSIEISGQVISPSVPSLPPLPPVDRRTDQRGAPTLWTLRRYAAALGTPIAPELQDHPAYFIGAVPSSAALRRLARLNDWQLGTRIRRPAPGNPDITTVGNTLLHCLPAIGVRYLKARFTEDAKDEQYPGVLPPSSYRYEVALKARHTRKRNDSLHVLTQTLPRQNPMPFAHLKEAQQQAIEELFIFEWLSRYGTSLLWEAIQPSGFIAHPEDTVLYCPRDLNTLTLLHRNGESVQIGRGPRVQ